MRKFIITFLILLGSTVLFCQIQMNGGVAIEIDAQYLPYKRIPASSYTRNGEIWRPLTSYFYDIQYQEFPYAENKYIYHKDGTLYQRKINRYEDTLVYCIITCNQTFTKEGFDFTDTITYYRQKDGNPRERTYYDYHYYDRQPEDSFYYVVYTQQWNDITKEWNLPFFKQYTGFFDTTLYVIREIYTEEFINGKWIRRDDGYRVFKEYNEDGLETSQITEKYNSQTGEYEIYSKVDFFYNEENIHVESYIYIPVSGELKLMFIDTDIEYAEWYPNGQDGIRIETPVNNPEYTGIADKRIKLAFFTEWILNDNEEWVKYSSRKYDWDLNGTKSHIDTTYMYVNDIPYLSAVENHIYDERENCTQRLYKSFYLVSDEILRGGYETHFHTVYHPLYDYPKSYCLWQWIYEQASQSWDSLYMGCWEYSNWHDITQPVPITEPESPNVATATALSIFPNPATGVVTISAAAEMQELSVYDITGRLVVGQLPAAKTATFDTGILAHGVYLVRAVMRDGGVRSGKVVVR